MFWKAILIFRFVLYVYGRIGIAVQVSAGGQVCSVERGHLSRPVMSQNGFIVFCLVLMIN